MFQKCLQKNPKTWEKKFRSKAECNRSRMLPTQTHPLHWGSQYTGNTTWAPGSSSPQTCVLSITAWSSRNQYLISQPNGRLGRGLSQTANTFWQWEIFSQTNNKQQWVFIQLPGFHTQGIFFRFTIRSTELMPLLGLIGIIGVQCCGCNYTSRDARPLMMDCCRY